MGDILLGSQLWKGYTKAPRREDNDAHLLDSIISAKDDQEKDE